MPEFLNRLDNIVCFKRLTTADLHDILELELGKLYDRIIMQSRILFNFDISPAAKRQLLTEGYDRRYNARELKRVIHQHIELPLGRLVSTGQVAANELLIVDYAEDDWKYYARTAENDKQRGVSA